MSTINITRAKALANNRTVLLRKTGHFKSSIAGRALLFRRGEEKNQDLPEQ